MKRQLKDMILNNLSVEKAYLFNTILNEAEKELNKQFELACSDGIKLDLTKNIGGWYRNAKTRSVWAGYCIFARQNGIKIEGE